MIRLILFDIDGTLIRSAGSGSVAFGRTFETLFNLPEAAKHLEFAGRTDRSLLQEFFDQQGIEPSRKLENHFFHIYAHWLAELLPQTEGTVLPGVRELMDGLTKAPTPPTLGLLTGNIRLAAELKLRHFGLWRHYPVGVFGDEHHCRNTLARMAVEKARDLIDQDLSQEEILIIGDTPHDIACARSIGAKSLAVATGGFEMSDLTKAGATQTVTDLTCIHHETLLSF